jgi:hypothetical protein
MVKVYFELYDLCFPALEKEAKKQRMIVTENIVDDKEEA